MYTLEYQCILSGILRCAIRVSVYTLGRISSYFLCMSVYSLAYQYTLLRINILSGVSTYILCYNSVYSPVCQCVLYSVYFLCISIIPCKSMCVIQFILLPSVYTLCVSIYNPVHQYLFYSVLCTLLCTSVYYTVYGYVYSLCISVYSPILVYTLLCIVQGTAGADGGGIFLRFVRPRGFERGRV